MDARIGFSVREMDEIRMALFYRRYSQHGTAGHNRLMLIAHLAQSLGIDFDFVGAEWTVPPNVYVYDGETGEQASDSTWMGLWARE